jgi:uncharacterized protein YdcH (DUF465 family)
MENHDLHHEFVEYDQLIHDLKVSNNHFRKLFDEYHKVNKDIHRLESNEVYTDTELNKLRSQRIHLKDDLYQILKQKSNNN